MSDDILDVRKYDPKIIELLEIICAFFVSRLYNSIYQRARVAHQSSDQSGRSIYVVLENYVLIYIDALRTEDGVSQEIADLYKFYTATTQEYISIEQFVLEVSNIFLPSHMKRAQRSETVAKAIQNIVPKCYSIVITNYLTHVHADRANKDVQRKIQDEFMRHALVYRFAEHERITHGKLAPNHVVNDKLVGKLTAMINTMKGQMKAMEDERARFRSTIILQHGLIKQQRQEIDQLKAATAAPPAEEPAEDADAGPMLEEIMEEPAGFVVT